MIRNILFFAATVASLAFVVSCSPSKDVRPLDELVTSRSAAGDYVVSSGDVLLVKVWGEPKLSGEVYVREDGKFTLPLIEDTPAEGKTLKQISEDVTKRLREYIPAAALTISVLQTAPIRYYLSGQFVKPGEYRSEGKITLLQAIATGGGFAPFADESTVMLIRQGAEGEIRFELDYNRVVSGNEPNPQLKNGDVISVE
jgi:polysaccharide export outer membrane protein